ncbi:MAG: Holliday junction resolvase RuvX [Bacilli bacterium]|nr:Holliday junction resolvase RuvX [Bacilli bacterium]MBR1749204.1 Holliday junction resolvase RuvX [Bacilli bacterium]MBR1817333.1 Holliday junction resolvase RuvX [Bacilli bacterium]
MRYMGLDLGTRSVGVSLSDRTNTIASPYKTIFFKEGDYTTAIEELKEIVSKENITEFVLGLPKNMNNTLGEAAKRSIDFKKMLETTFDCKVNLVDERLTTVQAEHILLASDKSRQKRKKIIDNVASSIILETFLKGLKHE